MKHTTTIIIGVGQAGLAMSRELSNRSIDHVIIEREEIADSREPYGSQLDCAAA